MDADQPSSMLTEIFNSQMSLCVWCFEAHVQINVTKLSHTPCTELNSRNHLGHVFSFFWCFSCAGVDLSSRLLQKVGSLISRASQAHLQVPLPSFTSCQGDRCSLRRSFGEGTTGQLRQEAARDSAQYNYYLLVNIHNFPFLLQFTSLLNLLTPFVLASRMPSP